MVSVWILWLMVGGLMVVAATFRRNYFRAWRGWAVYQGAGVLLGAISNLGELVDMGRFGFTWFVVTNGLGMACFVWAVVLAMRASRGANSHPC